MTLCHLVLQQKGSNQSQAAIFSHFWIASAVNPGDTMQSGFTALLIQNEFWIVFAVEPGVRIIGPCEGVYYTLHPWFFPS